ncbi:MAG: nucleotidyltransferase family protein [Fimbriimonadaceae bacterium]|nr:nucleotidyltransferase family protein [Fimbriimonadaceae bacterium]
MSTFDAIVPAGGMIDGPFADKAGTQVKALITFNGSTILETVLKALRESGKIRNIVVIGSPEVRAMAANFAAVGLEPGETGPDNIFRGLEHLKSLDPNLDKALIVTCDLPFITSETIGKYIELCPLDKDICVPVIEATDFNRSYPGTTSTFVKTRDGTFTIGGIFMMNGRKLNELRASIERVFAKRKSKLGMAMLIGPAFVFKYITKSLTLRDIETKIESILGCSGRAVRNAPVELAYDIDDLEDFSYAVTHAEKRD